MCISSQFLKVGVNEVFPPPKKKSHDDVAMSKRSKSQPRRAQIAAI